MPNSLGLVSVGYFYKNIDKFIYEQTTDEGYDYDYTSFYNGDDGYINGVEFAYQQKFNFLPSPLDGLSFLGSLTLSNSEANILPSDAGDPIRKVDFVRNSDTVGTVALSYEKMGFFIRLSGSYRSSYLDELGDDPLEDRYIDDHFQVDITSSYTFRDNYTVFLNLINVTDEPLKAYWGESGRLSQFEEYGLTARMGFKFHF
jgi:TonB-dependent receptor